MIKQPNITIVVETPTLPDGPVHYSTLDLQALVSARLDSIQDELLEIGCSIPADIVFLVEALGGVIDLETGAVTNGQL